MKNNRKQKSIYPIQRLSLKYLLSSLIPIAIGVTVCTTTYAQTWVTAGSAGFSSGAVDLFISIAINPVNGMSYVVYTDHANSDRATVMKDSSNTWVSVGSPGFSAGAANYPTIAIDGNGTPYVAYGDSLNDNKGVVKKYAGGTWADVGGASFTSNFAYYTDIVIGPNDTPYVLCVDSAEGDKATVRKYNGSSWEIVGGGSASAGGVGWCSMAIGQNGTIYVAYEDETVIDKATVSKYASGTWTTVGSPGFSQWFAEYPSIVLGKNDTPYVAYDDYYYGAYATVMKYNDSGWVTAGSPGFSPGPAEGYTNWIATDGCGTPYVAFTDADNAETMVMKYTGGSWETVGSSFGFSTVGLGGNTAMAIDGSGTPYVAYIDTTESDKATVVKLSMAPVTGVIGADSVTGNATLCIGDTIMLNDTAGGGSGAWSSGAAGVATIGTSGMVIGVAAGTATISYTVGCQSATTVVTVSGCNAGVPVITGNNDKWQVYPDPATTELTVNNPGGGYAITDMLGRTLLQGDLTAGTQTIDISLLPAGSYIFTGNKNNQRDYNCVVVKQ